MKNFELHLLRAIRDNDISTVSDIFLKYKFSPAYNEQYLFKKACEISSPKIVQLFLEQPEIKPDYDDNIAFIESCSSGNLPVVQLLSEDKRIDITARDNLGFSESCYRGKIEVTKFLLSNEKVNPFDREFRAFHDITYLSNNIEFIQLFINNPLTKDNFINFMSVKYPNIYQKINTLILVNNF